MAFQEKSGEEYEERGIVCWEISDSIQIVIGAFIVLIKPIPHRSKKLLSSSTFPPYRSRNVLFHRNGEFYYIAEVDEISVNGLLDRKTSWFRRNYNSLIINIF